MTVVTPAEDDVAVAIIFGRPGSGKTTVAETVCEISKQQDGVNRVSAGCNDPFLNILPLDLDCCVPQWMRNNFARGIYPTLAQRAHFAESACDFVTKSIEEKETSLESSSAGRRASFVVLISFSFVNTDLRQVFRARFPDATWILMDTTEEEAQLRIEKRQGHFYRGKRRDSVETRGGAKADLLVGSKPPGSTTQPREDDNRVDSTGGVRPHEISRKANSSDNSEWEFAPVTFPHTILNGTDPIDVNAMRVLQILSARTGPCESAA